MKDLLSVMRRKLLLTGAAAVGAALLFGFVLIVTNLDSSGGGGGEQPPPKVLDEDAVRAFNEYAAAVLNGGSNSNVVSPPASPSLNLTADAIACLFNASGTSVIWRSPSLQVWPRLKRVALRPDLFVHAKDAMAEAAPVWAQLQLQLHLEHLPQENGCHQFSAKAENRLHISCGLNLDSSISLIATPSGNSFGLHLRAADGRKLLSYTINLAPNVSLIQSSGTSRVRCPSSSSSSTVDGLSTCAHTSGKAQPFPLARGVPFVATIWLGWHGFHMSVNGKHVSSFKYRQNHEPWLVSSVQVEGEIAASSLMATGLPVSEARDAMPAYLIAPPLLSGKPLLFVGIFSTANNFARRMAIRRTWMQYEAVRSGRVMVRFFVGLDKSQAVNKDIWAEARDYNDTQLLPFVDHYELITLKTLAICIYAVKVVKAKFVMKADDDTFVRVDEVVSLVGNRSPKNGLLLGLIEYSASPNRDEGDKWYVSEKEWPYAYYPPWAHGPGYVISREIATYIVKLHDKSQLKLFKLEDVAMGIWVSEYAQGNNRVEYVHHDKFFSMECSVGYVIAHYQKPEDMVCLWMHLQRSEGPICCVADDG